MSDPYKSETLALQKQVRELRAELDKARALLNELEVHGNFHKIYLVPENRKCSDWISDAKSLFGE